MNSSNVRQTYNPVTAESTGQSWTSQGNASSSSSSSSSSGARASSQSQTNQAKTLLDFDALWTAKPYSDSEFHTISGSLTIKQFKDMDHDSLVTTINECALGTFSQTLPSVRGFLPLSYMSHALPKFNNPRFGTFSEGRSLFEVITSKLGDEITNKESPNTRKLYAEMMWLYISRLEDTDLIKSETERRMVALYEKCPVMETRDALLKYYNTRGENENKSWKKEKKIGECERASSEFKKTLKLYNEWPSYIPKGVYTFRYYLVAYKGINNPTTDTENVRTKFSEFVEQYPWLMEDEVFFTDLLKEYSGKENLDRISKFFDDYPNHRNKDKPRRELLSAYFKANKIEKAKEFFNNWPEGTMSQQTLEVMIGRMAQIDLGKAIQIFADDIKKSTGKFSKTISIQELNTHYYIPIKIDLHNTKKTTNNTQRYGPDFQYLVLVKLWYLYNHILTQINELEWVDIEIITGQGSENKLQNAVSSFLTNTFGWNCKEEVGYIKIGNRIKSLRQKNAVMPVRIDASTSLFLQQSRE